VGHPVRSAAEAQAAGQRLCERLNLEMAVITLDRDGMVLARRDADGVSVPTRARAVYDITGAGDVVIAVLGLCLGSGLPPEAAVHLGNVAAGLEVEKTGVAQVTREEIRREIESQQRPHAQKIVTLETARQRLDQQRAAGATIVMTNGCFDLLHVGHATYLAEAAALGDILLVAINSDTSVRRLKGEGRPVIGQADRAAMLAALACVDYVLVFDDATPRQLLETLRPDVLVKGGTYTPQEVVGREIVESYGGRVCVTGVVEGISTTQIVGSLQKPPAASVAEQRPDDRGPRRGGEERWKAAG
jgi:D-beta-D-heptose 7-phosphate kinase/D-beta-D-heptose 1-phosphate adenosyltransferase